MAILLLLFIILVLVLSIPAVQTRLGNYITEKLNKDFDTNITIEKVGLQFNGDIEFKNIYIEDHKKDTLFNVIELNASIISFKNLLKNKLIFGDIDVIGLTFNLKIYEGEAESNLDIFVAKFEEKQKTKNKSTFLLSSSDISITESEFRFTNENKETPKVFVFNELNINATDFLILGPDVSARINTFKFKDTRGIEIENLSTNFKYTLNDMNFENLQIITANSILKGSLKFTYNREDLKDFVDKVKIDAQFQDSKIALDEFDVFYSEFGNNQEVKISTTLSGTLNDLTLSNLFISISHQTQIDGIINFENLFNKEKNSFVMDANFNKLSTSYHDLKALLPNLLGKSLPPFLDNFKKFSIRGKTFITSKTVVVDFLIDTKFGNIFTDIEMINIDIKDKESYKGNIVLKDFNIGELLQNPKFGNTNLNLSLDGAGFSLINLDAHIKGDVFNLDYNNYSYKNITVSGNIKNNIFDGNLITNDKNLSLNFNGLIDFSEVERKYDFTATVYHANLKALNFVKKDSISIFKSIVKMNMNGSNIDDVYGKIVFKNTLYKNENKEYYFKDFVISSQFKDDIRFIEVNSPDIIKGSLSGKFKFKDISKLMENSLGNIYTNYIPYELVSEQFINFKFNIYNKIAEVFYPNLELGKNTYFKGRVESNAKNFNLIFKSPLIRLENFFAKNIQFLIDNKNPLFNTFIELDSIHTKYYNASKFSLINVTKNDTLFIKTEFNGGKHNADDFNLNLYYTINEENNSVIGFKKSEIKFKTNVWYVNETKNRFNKIEFDRDFINIKIEDLRLSNLKESIQLSGTIRDSTYKNINLDFKDVELAKITPRIDSLALAGNVNGKLNVQQRNGIYVPESNITIDNFTVNKFNLGSFKANIIGNESLTNYTVNVSLQEDETKSLTVVGNFDISGSNPSLNLNIDFNKFILNPLNPFGAGVITNIRGEIVGNAKVTGRLQHPQINGQLKINKGGLSIPYLNVDYAFEDNTIINLKRQSFIFENAVLIDSEYFSKSTLSGDISHVNFSKWSLGLNIDSDRILVLNTQDSEDVLYYGTAFVSGNINVAGPTDQLVITANVTTEKGTVFKIPLNDTEYFGDNSYIHFLSPEEKKAKIKGERILLDDIKGLEMNFDLDINENAEIEIVMDKDSGSSMKGKGSGTLLIQINTKGKFNMYGGFVLYQGSYDFKFGGLVQKEFYVLPGGTLDWDGNPLEAIMNIEAVYDNIKANPSVLLDNPINRNIPVEVKIHLTERLEKPQLDFDLSFPNVNSTLNSELQYRLNDKESKELQAISLLVTGSFRSELNFDSQDALGLVSDRFESMFNDIISTKDGKVNVGIDLQLGRKTIDYETDSRVGVTLSTKLSDNILINGKVGVPIGGVNETAIAGDFEIEMIINEDRTLSLKFFNRENSIRNFGEQIGYTQGMGLSYNIQFNSFKELINKIFKSKKKSEKEQKLQEELYEFKPLPEHHSFKKKDVRKQ